MLKNDQISDHTKEILEFITISNPTSNVEEQNSPRIVNLTSCPFVIDNCALRVNDSGHVCIISLIKYQKYPHAKTTCCVRVRLKNVISEPELLTQHQHASYFYLAFACLWFWWNSRLFETFYRVEIEARAKKI